MKHLPLPDEVRFLDVAGSEYYICWEDVTVGASFFLPTTATPKQVLHSARFAAKHFDIILDARPRVERGLYGIRVWRTA